MHAELKDFCTKSRFGISRQLLNMTWKIYSFIVSSVVEFLLWWVKISFCQKLTLETFISLILGVLKFRILKKGLLRKAHFKISTIRLSMMIFDPTKKTLGVFCLKSVKKSKSQILATFIFLLQNYKVAFNKYVDKTRWVGGAVNVNGMQIFSYIP